MNEREEDVQDDPSVGKESEAADVEMIEVDHVETVGRRGDATEIVVSGDNLDQDLTVTAGDQTLSAHAVDSHELHVEVPDAVIEWYASADIVSADGEVVGIDLSDVGAAFGTGLGGDGDTDF